MPNTPDAASCDYFLWGHLKTKIKKIKVKDLKHLKKLICRLSKNIPQEIINKALKSWPNRCRLIYYNKGKNIENYK